MSDEMEESVIKAASITANENKDSDGQLNPTEPEVTAESETGVNDNNDKNDNNDNNDNNNTKTFNKIILFIERDTNTNNFNISAAIDNEKFDDIKTSISNKLDNIGPYTEESKGGLIKKRKNALRKTMNKKKLRRSTLKKLLKKGF